MNIEWQASSVVDYAYSQSVEVRATPEEVYDLVTDIGRTGEWSPICRACWWRDGDGLREGAWFVGRNEAEGAVWETHSQVVAAQRGREFAWIVGGDFVRWSFRMQEAPGGGTVLTETWEFLPAGRAMFADKYGSAAPARIELRTRQARASIPATLAAVKRIAESVGG